MARRILLACSILGALAMVVMTVTVLLWMSLPTRIIYRESSPARSDVYRVEVTEHGHSYFLTTSQKQRLDLVRNGTPIVMFTGFAAAIVAYLVGAAARLRVKDSRG